MIDGKYTIIEGNFSGKLKNNSDIEYGLKIQELRHKFFINIAVKVDLSMILQTKGIQPWDTYEVMKVFDQCFVEGGILEKENVKFDEGIFTLTFSEEQRVDLMIVCEYLITVLKTCQQIEFLYSGISI